ncbi:hypothetical protein [Frondihabitans australicus]|uniref:Uncharacterized protein n=1 Tax=Frondihabitans australicus TaxID=386892 RepID=A0A495ID58_9MICO|nr:hypothetical protein [Frondihabitans australicus]RKR73943.1 hypothetical protein C8E83_1043 [Frondihabitans australicus]
MTTPGEVATWGGDLSQAIVRYVGHGESSYPRERPESVAQAFGPRSSGLVDDVRALLRETEECAADVDRTDAGDSFRAVRAAMVARHPELDDEAVRALAWAWSYGDR